MIWKRTDGNPLFTVSLLDFLACSGDIVHDGVSWNMASPPALMVQKIPDTVRAMIRQKSEVLEPDARLALQYASIEGEEFFHDRDAAAAKRANAAVLAGAAPHNKA